VSSADSRETSLLPSRPAGNEDLSGVDRLFTAVYAELRALARAQRRRGPSQETLDTTALVHEAYLKLAGQDDPCWRDRAHFCAVAATAMRHILIDRARSAAAAKRGGGRTALSLAEIRDVIGRGRRGAPVGDPELLILLDEALARLRASSPRHVRIVECRFFAGMTLRDTATALGVSVATVKRGWSIAQSWLYRDIERALQEGAGGA
jgi:RNA polymerase sigma factor (TIGR02999 family)